MNTLQPTIGNNKTGTARAPERCEDMLSGNDEFAAQEQIDGAAIAEVRRQYAQAGEPLGTLPPPASVKQVVKTAAATLKHGNPNLFTDKLGERLAFERTGARLYQSLISKLDAFGSFDGGPSRAELERIMDQEIDHFRLLQGVMQGLGADPTAITPAADLAATTTQGVLAAIVDPRINLLQSLEAILIAELTDNECWDTLIELAQKAGQRSAAASFEIAREHERQHLALVRAWIAAGQERRSGSA